MRAVSAGAEIELSAAEARGAALAAQGMGRPRPKGQIDARRLRRAIDDVGLLQLDSVNALCRSHYLPLFSRLGWMISRSRIGRREHWRVLRHAKGNRCDASQS